MLVSSGVAVDDCRQTTLVTDDHEAVPHALRAKLALGVASTVAKSSPATVTLWAVENARLAALTSLTTGAAGENKAFGFACAVAMRWSQAMHRRT